MQKSFDFGCASGSGVFSLYNIFAQWGQVLIPLFPTQHAGGSQAHTHFVSHRTEKGILIVSLYIKSQINDVCR